MFDPAQSAVKYGYEYKCPETVVVSYCRNDSEPKVHEDDNRCMVEYPDRPRNVPTIAVFRSVVKSELEKTLMGCTGGASSDPAIAKAQVAKIDTAVFGIQLGDPLDIPACQMFQIGGTGPSTCQATLVDQIAEMAWGMGGGSAAPATVKTVYLGVDECPSWVNQCTLVVTLYDGKVGAVGVFTKGPGVDGEVQRVLAEKYGSWTYVQMGTITANDPDKADRKAVSRFWELPGLYVQYQPIWSDADGTVSDIREGLIRVESETARTLRLDAAAKAPKKKM